MTIDHGDKGTWQYPQQSPANPERTTDTVEAGEPLEPRDAGHDTLQETQTNPDRAVDLGRISAEDDEIPAEKKSRMGKTVGAVLALVGVAGGIAYAVSRGPGEAPAPADPTASSAPAVPGQSTAAETTASKTPEVKAKATTETVELSVNGEEVVGIDAFLVKYGTFRNNVPNAPAPTKDEGRAIWTEYIGSLKAATNVEASLADKTLKETAINRMLFVPGATGALPDFVADLQSKGAKIVGIEQAGLLGAPDKTYHAQGSATVVVKGPDGTTEKYTITAALTNNFGIINAVDHVSTVGPAS